MFEMDPTNNLVGVFSGGCVLRLSVHSSVSGVPRHLHSSTALLVIHARRNSRISRCPLLPRGPATEIYHMGREPKEQGAV